jgi:hypothetical protein
MLGHTLSCSLLLPSETISEEEAPERSALSQSNEDSAERG